MKFRGLILLLLRNKIPLVRIPFQHICLIKFLGILGKVYLKVVTLEETKLKIHKWPSNNLL